MRATEPPMVEPAPSVEDYTKVTFVPDLGRFRMGGSQTKSIFRDALALFRTRVLDMAGCLPSVRVSLNGEVLPITGFKEYMTLYGRKVQEDEYEEGEGEQPQEAWGEAGQAGPDPCSVVYSRVNDRWEVGVRLSETGQFEHISFVNNMATPRGGSHVNLVATALTNRLTDTIRKAHPALDVTPAMVKSHLFLFVNALIENPSFDSQSKEMLTSQPRSFGSTCDLPESFIKEVLATSGIVEEVVEAARDRQNRLASKLVSGGSRKRLLSIPKLEDALNAGGPKAQECTLILTEGDSAKALAVAGLEVVGRDYYGVFPLRGKLLNVRDASMRQMSENQELVNLCMILGLDLSPAVSIEEQMKKLRYGHVMIMTDQDHDGVHIKGLLLNFFHFFWPHLVRRQDVPSFVEEFITPLIKVSLNKETIPFYSQQEYEKWKEERREKGDLHRWKIKYYKGLGTSTSAEGKQYFRELETHRKVFKWKSDVDCQSIDLAFSKSRTEDRKKWLINYLAPKTESPPDVSLSDTEQEVVVRDFINQQLVQFSYADLVRSIPSVVDGLKPSQRKVLYACFKKRLTNEIKVAQLAGYCAEHTAYHHGEQSLHATIINMAQDFVGSNNLPLLVPCGQFGTRLQGGKDAASPRYIFTHLASYTRRLFPEADDALLRHREDDGQVVEPEYFVPIIPLLLVNGTRGIGTGWSTFIPPHNPLHVLDAVERGIRGQSVEPKEIQPWVKGFRGRIRQRKDGNYMSKGLARALSHTSAEVVELPLWKWTADYKEFLNQLMEEGAIKGFQELHTTQSVRFVVNMNRDRLRIAAETIGLGEFFHLDGNFSVGNMHAFDPDGVIKQYRNAVEMLEDFMPVRSRIYEERRQKLEAGLEEELGVLSNKARFIQEVSNKDIDLLSRPSKNTLIELLHARGYKPRKDAEGVELKGKEFDYLLSIPLYNFTQEVHDRLQADKAKSKEKLETLQRKDYKDLWLEDLEVLREELERDAGFLTPVAKKEIPKGTEEQV